MISTTLIAGYEEHNKIYCSSSDRYKIFRVSKNINEEWNILEGFDIGLIRYDNVTSQVDFHSFEKTAHIVPVNYADDIFYYGTLSWSGNVATFTLNKIQYRTSKITDDEIYSFELMDYGQDGIEYSNLWGMELFVLSERYICLAIPYANKIGGIPSRFSQFMLVDTIEKNSYTLPESIGDKDTILRLDAIRVFNIDNQTFILLHTGRILINEKEELWRNEGNNNLHAMLQSVVLMELDEFVDHIMSDTPIGSSYIIDTSLYESGIANISINENMVILLKRIFHNNTTECVFTNVLTGEQRVIIFNDSYTSILSVQGKIIGFLYHESGIGIYNLDTGELELSLNDSEMLVYIGTQGSYIVSRSENNRLFVDCKSTRNVTNILDIEVSDNRYLLMYNEQMNGMVCIL
ncbi:hypothetical protein PAEVO_43340 [Paenibacillus sp. GM2FR]|uniref:hypothetical protein n=1 Tax=Paenibacillus sp. GM2FR TaxID=2059268 RepID=UPI000C2776C8|nr:hypothetical protein [Paenibacillus sp. GM2FR]PJN51243.1 hypothetical protein PAEVO_43340 [Paenibacillus sp. GM2FR]